jgi:transposase-like protein
MGRPSGYPEEFRREAVRMALAPDTSWASVARRLGVNETTLRNWVHEYLAEERRGRSIRAQQPPELATPAAAATAAPSALVIVPGYREGRPSSHAFDGLQPSGPNGLPEGLVVPLVLCCVAL